MQRFFRLFVLVISACFCFGCATVTDPTVKAYNKMMALLHIKSTSDADTAAVGAPNVCTLDPAGMIPQQSGDTPQDTGKGPSVQITELAHDFGAIREDGDYVHQFKMKNVGNAVLNIKKVVPG